MLKLDQDRLQVLLDEALVRVVEEPDQIDEVLVRAREYAGAAFEPADEAQFSVFVGGPLFHAVDTVVGAEAAEALMAYLNPILSTWLTQSTSGAWRQRIPSSWPPPRYVEVLLVMTPGIDREAVKRLLCSEGYSVTCVDGGREAVELCRDRSCALLMVDAGLPEPVGADKLIKLVRLGMGDMVPPVLLLGEPEKKIEGVRSVLKPAISTMLRLIREAVPPPDAS